MKIVTVHIDNDSGFPVRLGECLLDMECMGNRRIWAGVVVKTETVAENGDAHVRLSQTGGIFE